MSFLTFQSQHPFPTWTSRIPHIHTSLKVAFLSPYPQIQATLGWSAPEPTGTQASSCKRQTRSGQSFSMHTVRTPVPWCCIWILHQVKHIVKHHHQLLIIDDSQLSHQLSHQLESTTFSYLFSPFYPLMWWPLGPLGPLGAVGVTDFPKPSINSSCSDKAHSNLGGATDEKNTCPIMEKKRHSCAPYNLEVGSTVWINNFKYIYIYIMIYV